jgi:nitronate monooxygenase
MVTLDTALCDRLGVEHPVVQAPIGSASCPELAAAVSNAGGLGTLAITWLDLDETREAIRETKAATDGPIGVNLVLDPAARERPTERHLDVCLDEGVDVISVSFGDAAPYVDRVHDAGGTVLQTVSSVKEARRAVEVGADVLVVQGWEAGGHVQGEVATMPLVPQVVDVAETQPVVAAGGIADGRGVAAALALGADGAWLGTRFVATEEAAAHQRYKDELVDSPARETVYSPVFDKGWPGTSHRTLRNTTVSQWIEAGRPEPGARPGEEETVAEAPDGRAVERYDDDPPVPGTEGDVEAMAMYAGQSTGLVEAVLPAAAVVDQLVESAARRIEELGGLVAE